MAEVGDCARCMIKFALHHTYVVLHLHRVVWHGVCAIHNRWNSVHSHYKLFVVKWLWLNVTVRVRARDRECIFSLP